MFTKLLLATHNTNKVNELKSMLSSYKIEIISASELNLPDIEETGTTFAENAILKAEALSDLSGLACLADDSGLCVDALDGRPGVYTARYAPNRDFDKGMDKLLQELKDKPLSERKAHFSCVLALKTPSKHCQTFEGRVDGTISLSKHGNEGFGFDPVFIPQGYSQTFAEMSKEQKANLSHRGKALKQFIKEVFETV
ncbi:MAG: RdgB/HAM1 family non-canonical purine NTP pyrophosphatase [Alphaproteobacteria bacterium]|nr:RdgB/HAM1 family non-canonical purine NTP pyrophosphatase [Alphaproteobacteria bacterium]